MEKEETQLQFNLNSETAKGTYANLGIVAHSNEDFVFDFVSILPGMPKGEVVSRIVMTPGKAKKFLKALQRNIEKFEEKNGEINDPDKRISIFGSKNGEA